MTERAQPWLGTLVGIRIEGLPPHEAHQAIGEAFAEVALVHRLMSFHAPDSDLGRLNRSAGEPVAVHSYTFQVLEQALHLSVVTDGCFDVTVGTELVEWGLLPGPRDAKPISQGSWCDIELLRGNRVMLHRLLSIDLGGIAKGFAVDRATDVLRRHGASRAVVNAGGDIRVFGKNPEPIRLGAGGSQEWAPVLELSDGSVASSCGHDQRHWHGGQWCGPHVDGARRTPASTGRFACVAAEDCVIADALTKVVLAQGTESAAALRQFGATAYMHDPGQGWRCFGAEEASAS